MDQSPEQNRRPCSKREEEGPRLSEFSIQRLSQSNRASSFGNRRVRLQEIVSADGSDMKDDIYQYYLLDQNVKFKLNSANNSQRGSGNQNQMQAEEPVVKRYSSNNRRLNHDCNCSTNNCLGFHCPCLNDLNQVCVNNQCCPNCIKIKNQLQLSGKIEKSTTIIKSLKNNCKCLYISKAMNLSNFVCTCTGKFLYINTNIEHQNLNETKQEEKKNKTKNKDQTKQSTNSCSCKKSHCLKKYCLCYSSNRTCTPECQCQGCHNCQKQGQNFTQQAQQRLRYANANVELEQQNDDIDQYLHQENYQQKAMPESMQFQFPDLKNSYQN